MKHYSFCLKLLKGKYPWLTPPVFKIKGYFGRQNKVYYCISITVYHSCCIFEFDKFNLFKFNLLATCPPHMNMAGICVVAGVCINYYHNIYDYVIIIM